MAQLDAAVDSTAKEGSQQADERMKIDEQALRLRAVGCTYRQIAEQLNIGVSGAYQRVMRQLRRQRECLPEMPSDRRDCLLVLLESCVQPVRKQAKKGNLWAFALLMQYANLSERFSVREIQNLSYSMWPHMEVFRDRETEQTPAATVSPPIPQATVVPFVMGDPPQESDEPANIEHCEQPCEQPCEQAPEQSTEPVAHQEVNAAECPPVEKVNTPAAAPAGGGANQQPTESTAAAPAPTRSPARKDGPPPQFVVQDEEIDEDFRRATERRTEREVGQRANRELTPPPE